MEKIGLLTYKNGQPFSKNQSFEKDETQRKELLVSVLVEDLQVENNDFRKL